ncbi:MAG TPA: branched-chain amino acid aminotransferase [Mycobacteriales bacterium]|nr:branched-chain amino acid aminotransferase [Mycobacteriales bacterium]
MTSLASSFTLRPSLDVTSDAELAAKLAAPGFGSNFTDHMITVDYTVDRGWHDAQLVPYAPIALDPSAAVFHYAQSVFEGLKAYRMPDGAVTLFRPDQNAQRFQRSCDRLAIPRLPESMFLESIRVLVEQDRAWVPQGDSEFSLYLRPFCFATEGFLGVRPARRYKYLLIASLAGSYFASGVAPVSVWLSTDYTRAAPGGTGEAKCGGNYAASLVAQAQALEHGCDQVVWLDAAEHAWVEEMGGMNIFFVFTDPDGEVTLVTPELNGSLLPGVTRDSLLRLAPDLSYRIQERRISTAEWRAAAASGELTEVFACGTAAVITPVGTVKSNEGEFRIADGEPGQVTLKLRQLLLDLQHGHAADERGWRHTLLPAA